MSLLSLISGVTWSDKWLLFRPVEEHPVCVGVPLGDPLTASANDLPGVNPGDVLLWGLLGSGVFGVVLVEPYWHPTHPSKLHPHSGVASVSP